MRLAKAIFIKRRLVSALCAICMLCLALISGCAGQNVEVRPRGEIGFGIGVGR